MKSGPARKGAPIGVLIGLAAVPAVALGGLWQYADAEVDFFDDVVSGVVARQDEIDALLTSKLAENWSVARLDKTMLQILRAGTYELLARADVPTGTAISEYVDVAHAFFDEREAKFVNGVLDAVAKAVR